MSRKYGGDKYPKGFTTTLVRRSRKSDATTPGPWKLVYGEGTDHDGYKIIGNGHTVSEYSHSVIPRDEMVANARLVTAAPEMLDALRLAEKLRGLECSILTNQKLDIVARNAFRNEAAAIESQIRYVIAKAEGKK